MQYILHDTFIYVCNAFCFSLISRKKTQNKDSTTKITKRSEKKQQREKCNISHLHTPCDAKTHQRKR